MVFVHLRQWCGNYYFPESAPSRLLEFARNTKWGYMTYAEMMFGIHCRPGFLYCEKQFEVSTPACRAFIFLGPFRCSALLAATFMKCLCPSVGSSATQWFSSSRFDVICRA